MVASAQFALFFPQLPNRPELQCLVSGHLV